MQTMRKNKLLRACAVLLSAILVVTMMPTGSVVYAAAKKPAQVKNVKLVSKTKTSLKVKWAKPKYAKTYQVAYKTTGAKKFSYVKAKKKNVTLSKLKSGVTYQVKVRAINGTKKGKWSAVKKFKTKTAKMPVKVTGFKVSDATKNSFKAKWSKAKNAESYQIAYKKVGAKSYTYKTTKKLSYTVSKLKVNTTYQIKVRAINGSKKGKWSVERKMKTAFAPVDIDDEDAILVSAGEEKITIDIKPLGEKGEAALYRLNANQYLAADSQSGLVTKNTKGTKVGSFDLGTGKTFTTNRVSDSGHDRVYDKYYIVQDGKILKGPIYATTIAAMRGKVELDVPSKKGLVDELDERSFEAAEDLGSNWTALNIDFTQLILANETADGTPVDNSTKNADQIEVNGKTYYINSNYVGSLDTRLSRYEKMGVNVVGVVISFVESEGDANYPRALKYIDDARWTNGFNTSNELGRDYFIAGMEYIANRYSKGGMGRICNYVIGNEVDYAYDWNEIIPNESKDGSKLPPRGSKYLRDGEIETVADFDVYMEEYSRTLRLANIAVKKYSDDITVGISLSKEWTKSKGEQQNATPTTNKRIDSYRPKEMLDWLNYNTKKQGNYDWTITQHNYPIDNGNTSATETGLTGATPVITGNPETSTMITQNNLEVLQDYLMREGNLYRGNLREIYLTENGSSSGSEVGTPTVEMQKQQAAAVAQHYYRAASLPSVKAIIYYKITDRAEEGSTSFKLGLYDTEGEKKLAYNVWKYIDTYRSFDTANKYLENITFMKDGQEYSKANGRINSYLDVMKMTGASFDWDKYWNEDTLTPVKKEEGSEVAVTLKTDKTEYGADDPILVTATGDKTHLVGLYKRGETTEDFPIYSYEVGGEYNGTKFKSGRTYDIRAYGEIGVGRSNDARLPAGDYTVILSGDGMEPLKQDITISGNSAFRGTPKIVTNKMTYKVGEDILVTANGAGTDWACIYRKGEVAEDGNINGAPSPIYWYYIAKEGHISGKPVVLQNTNKSLNSSHPGKILEPGEYYVILLANDGYEEKARLDGIVIEPKEGKELASVTYDLDNPTDGYAAGTVTVNVGEDSAVTECNLYWGDAEGKPLEGYTVLNRFRITDAVTSQRMKSNTIIPPGAKTLVVYAVISGKESDEPEVIQLPEGAAYEFQSQDQETARFAVASDIHIAQKDSLNEYGLSTNGHFEEALRDIVQNLPGAEHFFVNGDIADNGKESEYREVMNIWQSVEGAPTMHITIGNHDWRMGNPNGMFQKYINWFNPAVETETLYYDEWVNGYHYIYLGSEEKNSSAVLSNEQLTWLDKTLEEHAENDQDKPVFLFLHQGLQNSVSGNLTGQWGAQWGVVQDTMLKNILKKYGNIIMFGSHTHAELDESVSMNPGTEELPVYFNTGSVSYMWDYEAIAGSTDGELSQGARGYFAHVFEDGTVYMFGRDFLTGEFISSAMHVVEPAKLTVENQKIGMNVGDSAINLGVETEEGMQLTYRTSNAKVASVDYKGNVRAIGPGTAKIYISTESSDCKTVNRKVVTVTVE